MARDVCVDKELREQGWTPIHFLAKYATKNTDACIAEIIKLLAKSHE